MRPRALPIALVASLCLSGPAFAAACCLSSSAFGEGRLASWEKFAFVVNTSGSPVAGRWDETTVWQANAPGYYENEWRAQLSALATVTSRLQVSGRLPVVMTNKGSGDLKEVGAGLGDSRIGLRFEPIFQGEYAYAPELAVNVGLTMPTGRTTSAARTILGSDVTGRGAWVPSASLTAEVARAIWFAQLGAGITVPLPMAGLEPGATQRFGVGWQATVAGGVEVSKGLVLSLVARYGYEGPLVIDGQSVPGSQAYDFGGGPAVAWKVAAHWTLQAGLDVGLYFNGLGENRQGRTTVTLGARYAHF